VSTATSWGFLPPAAIDESHAHRRLAEGGGFRSVELGKIEALVTENADYLRNAYEQFHAR